MLRATPMVQENATQDGTAMQLNSRRALSTRIRFLMACAGAGWFCVRVVADEAAVLVIILSTRFTETKNYTGPPSAILLFCAFLNRNSIINQCTAPKIIPAKAHMEKVDKVCHVGSVVLWSFFRRVITTNIVPPHSNTP